MGNLFDPANEGEHPLIGRDHGGPEVLVPPVDEHDDEHRGDHGARERHQNVDEELDRASTINAGGFDQFFGDRAEKLSEKERGGGRGDQGDNQALIGVQHAEFLDDFIGRQDAHLERQQQRREDNPERHCRELQAEINDGVGGHHTDDNLSDGKAKPEDQRVVEHAQACIFAAESRGFEHGFFKVDRDLIPEHQTGTIAHRL